MCVYARAQLGPVTWRLARPQASKVKSQMSLSSFVQVFLLLNHYLLFLDKPMHTDLQRLLSVV